MRKLALILALCACFPVVWQPLRGQSDKPQDSKSTQTETITGRQGTKGMPLIVDMKGHVNTPQETADDEADKHHKALIDSWTVGSAIAVAIFTFLLVMIGYFGVRYAKETLGAIKTQGEQADRHLMMTERPWIGTVSLADGDMRPDGPERQIAHTVVTLKNTGPSVALKGFMLPFLIASKHDVLPTLLS
jgi:hypothetical protein